MKGKPQKTTPLVIDILDTQFTNAFDAVHQVAVTITCSPNPDTISIRPFVRKNSRKRAAAWKAIDAFGLGLLALTVSADLGFAGPALPNHSQDEYDRLMQAGYKLLQEGEEKRLTGELARHAGYFYQALPHYVKAIELDEQALELFKSAETYAPQDRRKHAVFFQGVALVEKGNALVAYNRASKYLKRGVPRTFCNALHEIERSRALGMTPEVNPAFLFELGLALMGTGDYKEGKRVLDLFDSPQGNPTQQEQSKIAESLRGTAQKTIEDGNKKITPSILATCDTALIPLKAPTREDKEAPSAEETESQIKWSLTTGAGYDGNVTHLGRGLPLPEGLPGKGAAFNETTLSLEGDWFLHHKGGEGDLVDELTTNYAIIHDAYDDHSDSNSLSQTGIISYCHAINSKMCMGSQIGDTWLRDDKQNLSNTLAANASLGYQEFDRLSGKIGYTLSWNKYFTPSTSLTSLDGFTNRIAIQQRFIAIQAYRNWSPSLAVTAQYGQEWTTTEGIVGDRQREAPAVIVEWVIFRAPDNCSFVRRVTLASSYEYRHDEYENATFPDLDAANRYKRQDDTHLAEFAISIKMWYDEKVRNRMEAILDYKWNRDNSNVPEKSFDDPRFLAALKFNF